MKLSHRKKLAHKRSGVAKGWSKVVRKQAARKFILAYWRNLAYEVAEARLDSRDNAPGCGVREEKPKQSILSRFVNLVSSPFRRLRAAGTAQADILRGRLG